MKRLTAFHGEKGRVGVAAHAGIVRAFLVRLVFQRADEPGGHHANRLTSQPSALNSSPSMLAMNSGTLRPARVSWCVRTCAASLPGTGEGRRQPQPSPCHEAQVAVAT